MISEKAGLPSDYESSEDALLNLLARLVARRFLQSRFSQLRNEKCSDADALVEKVVSLDPEEETE